MFTNVEENGYLGPSHAFDLFLVGNHKPLPMRFSTLQMIHSHPPNPCISPQIQALPANSARFSLPSQP